MSTTPLLTTPYGRRVALVQDAIREHSNLEDDAARDVAIHVLHVLDSIPPKTR